MRRRLDIFGAARQHPHAQPQTPGRQRSIRRRTAKAEPAPRKQVLGNMPHDEVFGRCCVRCHIPALPGYDLDLAVVLFASALGIHIRIIAQSQMHNPALVRRHGLERHRLA